jgi:hypothetical protein
MIDKSKQLKLVSMKFKPDLDKISQNLKKAKSLTKNPSSRNLRAKKSFKAEQADILITKKPTFPN